MGKKEKNRLPEKQSALVKDFHAKNQICKADHKAFVVKADDHQKNHNQTK